MYTNEVCSDPIRGRSGCFYDMMQVFGILFVYIVTASFSLYWASNLCMLIPTIFLCTFYWMPESPLCLVKQRRQLEAIDSIRSSLSYLCGTEEVWFYKLIKSEIFFSRWFHGEDCDVEKQLARINMALLEGKENELYYNDEPSYYWTSTLQFFRGLR